VDLKAKKVDNKRKETFHSIVQKLLWVAQRGRPDVMLAVSFLCMRVDQPDMEYLKKVRRLLCLLKQTINDTRVIGADSLEQIDTFIDSSDAVHPDMRGHTGGAITMGIGIIHGKASKQTMNSKSTNETEVIGDSEYLPYAIWVQYFMDEQGRKIKRYILW